jgi:parvulin-like peptidyl-prolyl isomerase
MTFRTRTAPQQTRRRTRRSDTRRAIYVTLTFSLAIVVALAMLGGVFFASYYTAHWAPVAGVNGQGISTDDVYSRAKVNLARYQRQLADYTTLRNQGKITSDEFSNFQNTIQNNMSGVMSAALTDLENELALRQWAASNGVTVTSQQVDEQIVTDGTINEMRHVMVIGVAPEPTPPAFTVTSAEDQAAKAKAQGYLDEINGGKKWTDVATEAHAGEVGASSTTGDLGLIQQSSLNLDPDLRAAIFALPKVNDITSIFRGSDGIYRFATVTEIVPKFVDTGWQTAVANASNGGAYRTQAEGEAIKAAVQKVIEAKYVTGETTQRNVLELSIAQGYGQPGSGDEVQIRMMTFAPNHSVSDAMTIPTTDPAWTDAKNRADAAVAALRADPSKFDAMARDTKTNDDPYWATSGGLVPWIPADLFMDTTQSGQSGLGIPNVQAAVFASGLTPGQILDPILEASQGYVVVQFEGRRPAPDQRIADAQLEIASGADFATVAAQQSEAANAADGAVLGWVSPYMLSQDEQDAIFATPIGGVSTMVTDNGYHIYKVLEEKTRVQDPAEQLRLKDIVFARWLSDLQSSALIWTNDTIVSALASATP